MQKRIERILIVLNLACVLVSCGQPQNPPMQNQSIDPALSEYLEQFQAEGASRGIETDASHLTMSFNETMPPSAVPNGTTLAYCQRSSIGNNVIVKGSWFYSQNVSDREQLVFHELGHCLLGLEHIPTTEVAFWYGTSSPATVVPSSIMNAVHFDSGLYNGNRTTYLSRLFDQITVSPLLYNAPSQFTPIYN